MTSQTGEKDKEKVTAKPQLTGYPSVDRPWLKYYTEEIQNAPLPECSLYEYLWNCNKDHQQDYALNFFGKKMTFGRLFEMIDEVAKAFRAMGVKEGEIVSIVTISTVAGVVCFYALNRIGAVANYLNVLAEEKDLADFFEEAQSKVVVSLDLFARKVLGAAKKCAAKKCVVEKVVVFPLDLGMPVMTKMGYRMKTRKMDRSWKEDELVMVWSDFVRMADGQPEITYQKDSDKMCLLAHTGGTTGVPKAVMLSDRAMNAVASEQISIYKTLKEYKRGSVFLQVMIPFVVYGILTCIHMPLCAGWCLALVPKFDGKDWKKYISQYKFSYVFAVPAYVNALLENKDLRKTNLSMLKIIAAGGDGINNDMEHNVNKFLYEHGSKAELFKGYGMTEICAAALVSTPVANRVGSVGIPLPKNNVMIYDRESKAELTYGEIGEICMQCPSRMLGYKDNEEATKELFWTHEDGSEWLHTGDLGYMDEDGFLFLVGRMKRIILTTKDGVAYKVFPNIPEEMIVKHEAVAQYCIVGAMDGADQVLRAFVVPDKNRQGDTASPGGTMLLSAKETMSVSAAEISLLI